MTINVVQITIRKFAYFCSKNIFKK